MHGFECLHLSNNAADYRWQLSSAPYIKEIRQISVRPRFYFFPTIPRKTSASASARASFNRSSSRSWVMDCKASSNSVSLSTFRWRYLRAASVLRCRLWTLFDRSGESPVEDAERGVAIDLEEAEAAWWMLSKDGNMAWSPKVGDRCTESVGSALGPEKTCWKSPAVMAEEAPIWGAVDEMAFHPS